MNEDWQRIKNYTLYKLPYTDREMEDAGPVLVVIAIVVLAIVVLVVILSPLY